MKKLLSLLFCFSLVSCTTPVEPVEEPAEEPVVFEDFYIALVALSDGEAKPEPTIGCGDAIELVTQKAKPMGMEEKVKTALEALFSIKESTYGESGLYNALYQSNLAVETVNTLNQGLEGGSVEVTLSGSIVSGGVCDDPRIEEQIMQTIEANTPEGTTILVYIDGKTLDEYFDLSGQ
jgi:hypothetical protein